MIKGDFMKNRVRPYSSLILVTLMLAGLLAACGDNTAAPTSAPVATTAASATTAAAATTAAGGATTAAATTAAGGATTAAATTAAGGTATTAAATTAAGGTATTAAATTAAGGTATTAAATTAGGSTGAALTLPANCTNVQLAYWNGFTGPDGPFMGQIVDAFNKANSGKITVKMTSQADYGTQLTTAAASDTLPDIAIINEDAVATNAFNNVIRPIDDVVAQLGVSASDFPKIAWDNGVVAGKRYTLPLSIVPMTMFYNADMLKAAGITAPPMTDADFQKAAAAMTTGGNKGFVITSGFPVQQIFQQLLHQFGGSEFNADVTQATWNSDAGVKAVQWMLDAQKKYSDPALEVDADLTAFKAGGAGMIWNGIWQTTNVTGSAVSFSGMATAAPQIGTQPATWAGMASLALPVHKKGNDACKDAASAMLMKYILDKSLTWSKAGNVPAYNKVRNSADIASLHPQAELAKAVENPVFPPSVAGIGDAFGPLSDAITALMTGKTTDIKKALDDAATKSNQTLAANKAKYGTAPKS